MRDDGAHSPLERSQRQPWQIGEGSRGDLCIPDQKAIGPDHKKLELFLSETYSLANSVRCLPQLFINAAADSERIGVFRPDLRSSAKQNR